MSQPFKPVTGIFQGSAIFLVSSLIAYLARFGTSILVARSLGPDGKGTYVLVITLSAFMALFFSFGMNSAITYLTASRTFDEKELFAFSTWAALALGVLAGLVFYPLYSTWLSHTLLIGVSPGYILLVLLLLPLGLWSSFLASILLGQQLMVPYNLITLVQVFLNLCLQILSSFFKLGIPGAVLAWAMSVFCGLVLALWFTRKAINLRVKVLKAIFKPSARYGIKSYLANVMTFFNYRLDSFLVNNFNGTGAVGLYDTGVSMAEVLFYVPNAVGNALFPKVSRLDAGTAGELTARLTRIVLLLLLPAAILFGAAGIFLIPLIFGSSFSSSTGAFLLLLPGILCVSFNKIISAHLSGIGKPQYASYTAAGSLLVTIALDLLLIPKYSFYGAAVASSIAYLISALLSAFWFRRETKIPYLRMLLPTADDFKLLYQQSQFMVRRFARK
jgi:O-antigen/teichoic acid export membrane protein